MFGGLKPAATTKTHKHVDPGFSPDALPLVFMRHWVRHEAREGLLGFRRRSSRIEMKSACKSAAMISLNFGIRI
jgi:hypothetical protein